MFFGVFLRFPVIRCFPVFLVTRLFRRFRPCDGHGRVVSRPCNKISKVGGELNKAGIPLHTCT